MNEKVRRLDNRDLDIATLVARLSQIKHEGYAHGHWLLDRIITCDLPRLEMHLTPDARQAVRDAINVWESERNVE